MKFTVLTLFPEMFASFIETSIMGRAINENKVEIELINYRDFSTSKHKSVDDYPYGGGSGMVIKPEPLVDAIRSVCNATESADRPKVIYMSPKGRVLDHAYAEILAKTPHMVIVCGHYEGIDERIIDLMVDDEISIGDYVLTGGELPAMVMMDCLARLTGDVLGNESSHIDESHASGLLEYPQYTRPPSYEGHDIPAVLISGHHGNIELWRFEESIKVTYERRKDLLLKYAKSMVVDGKLQGLSKKQKEILLKYVGIDRSGKAYIKPGIESVQGI